jgi:hypothetical protein
MPYYIFELLAASEARTVGVCEHFQDALVQEKALRDVAGTERTFKIVPADNESSARELLFHVPAPEEGVIGEA